MAAAIAFRFITSLVENSALRLRGPRLYRHAPRLIHRAFGVAGFADAPHRSSMNDCRDTSSSGLLPLLLRAGTAVAERLEQSVEPWSLSLAKLRAMEQLADAPDGVPLGQLAERLSCVKSNVTQLVDRLEADGFVRRVQRPNDKRCVVATLTDKGRASLRSASAARERAEREVLGRLDDGDRERLVSLLGRLTAEVG
jgi:DNA-binding MarR family transcriptional regulator